MCNDPLSGIIFYRDDLCFLGVHFSNLENRLTSNHHIENLDERMKHLGFDRAAGTNIVNYNSGILSTPEFGLLIFDIYQLLHDG